MKKIDLTWHEVLSNKGFDSSISGSLIGFIAWEKDNIFPKMGQEINDALLGYEGKVVAKDVMNTKYNNIGILFVSNDISDTTASEVFDAILDYEHKEVYDFQ
ncbi:hypothetical protein R9X47_04655 [Wukongibacter baidiensis]|uniref:hypothetical protein n=1 Tax=Wukongibacter baidiensis TaxID=1723361 RepID=UPI003D7F1ADC